MATYTVRIARDAGLVLLFVVAALLGTVSGVLFAYSDDLPEITALDDYRPSTITRVLARDGSVVGEFAVERRVIVGYDEIPARLREAILAAEDAGFLDHSGLSVSRMLVALARDLIPGTRAPGRSTLTQQLARHLFPDTVGFDRTWERKVKEAIVAVQLEKHFTKPEIFTLYCNQMYFGHGAYGVEAAAHLYFDKTARDLSLEEAALIAGLFQGNVRQSPYVNPGASLRRRNYVLERMAEEGFVTREEADAAKARPVVARGDPTQASSMAPYFLEEVRKQVEARQGAKALYESGLTIRTTVDPALQVAANQAIDRGLRRIDKRRGFRKATRNVTDEGQSVATFALDRWSRPMKAGDIVPAIVMTVEPKQGAGSSATVRVGTLTATLDSADFKWTRRSHAADLMRVGDLIEVELTSTPADGKTVAVRLEQTPIIQAALVAIENRTGQVLAMVGGQSFARSKFNRATQAYRQLGSTFKPILFTAAIDRGLTPSTLLTDAPASFNVGPNQPLYAPRNYDGKYEGTLTLRRALEQSRNIPAVRVMEMLGPQQVVDYAKRFGFPEDFPAFLSTALGASEATLLEATSAYSAFPNNGVRLQPYLVEAMVDREGSVLVENRPEPRDAIRADTAFVMTSLLRGVVVRGTGAAAASLDWPLAGKTGTVDDYTDAWFVGFDPRISVGVWVGYDEKKPLGPNETGAQAALPIWIDFMKAYIDAKGDRANPPTFDAPGNIVFVTVDRGTGEALDDGATGGLNEAFIAGTQPTRQE
jgi:penicillin-binding protein 1A